MSRTAGPINVEMISIFEPGIEPNINLDFQKIMKNGRSNEESKKRRRALNRICTSVFQYSVLILRTFYIEDSTTLTNIPSSNLCFNIITVFMCLNGKISQRLGGFYAFNL